MNKTSLIIQREYLTRVRKKSFIVMTLLTPFLLALVFVVPALMMSNQDKDFKKIAVVGDSDLYQDVIPDTKEADFEFLPNTNVNDIKNNFSEQGYYGVLYISDLLVDVPNASTADIKATASDRSS